MQVAPDVLDYLAHHGFQDYGSLVFIGLEVDLVVHFGWFAHCAFLLQFSSLHTFFGLLVAEFGFSLLFLILFDDFDGVPIEEEVAS